MNVVFEWDEAKNLSNFKKHGVWFAEAQTIWADENGIEFYDMLHSATEDRFIRIGHASGANAKILLVIFCERENGNIIRLISAREATFNEQKDYEERI